MTAMFACAGAFMGMFVLAVILYSIVGMQTMWFVARKEVPHARWWFLLGCIMFWPVIYVVIVFAGLMRVVNDYRYGKHLRKVAEGGGR